MTEKDVSRKKIKIEFDEITLWKIATLVFGILFIISILTKGFTGSETKISGDIIKEVKQPEKPATYSNEDIKKIKVFVECLKEKSFHIFGADWCGWTNKLVIDTFGGFDIVEPIYTECTTEQELCTKEGIKGYPTIKIDGKVYQSQRTFEEFSKATGCKAPNMGN